MAGVRLRPQAERAHRRASARSVERKERIQQERDVVARDVQIALVDFRDPGQRVQILDDRPFGIVDDLAVLAIADARQFLERRALGVGDDLMIELAPHDEIDGAGRAQGLFRLHGHRRSDERHLQLRVGVLHHLRHLHIHVKTGRRGEQHQQLEILRHGDGLLDRDLVRRRVDHLAVGQHARGIAEPDRIPIGFDLARSRPRELAPPSKPSKEGGFRNRVLIHGLPDFHWQCRASNRFTASNVLPSREYIAKCDVQFRLAHQARIHDAMDFARNGDAVAGCNRGISATASRFRAKSTVWWTRV